ncbi:MAG: hypothetical protein RSE41_01845 [Clostridia bacterium]
MEKLLHEKAERIMDLVEWFEEQQPNDLEQIERILLGLRYINIEVVKSDLKQDIYRYVQMIEEDSNLKVISAFAGTTRRNEYFTKNKK